MVSSPVAHAGVWKGVGQEFQKIWEEQRPESEIVPLKFSWIFCPKLGEERKKKVFIQIQLDFSPKIRWRAKKKRSSLKCSPIFRPNVGATLEELH